MRKTLKNLILIFAALLCAELCFLGYLTFMVPRAEHPVLPTQPSGVAATEPTETGENPPETMNPVPNETTLPPETEPVQTEPPETEPTPKRYVLSFAGDCTLASDPGNYASPHGFIQTVGEDYGYPFRNVEEYFKNDDFTIINLESVLADEGFASNKLFCFKGPTAYTQILTGSSVDAVTLANNHTADYGKAGYDSTLQALTGAGVPYVEENKTKLVTTESGLVIGLYADSFQFNDKDIKKNIQSLRSQGAEIIICAYHWGTEGSYRATKEQERLAHLSIDAGADIVYGHHPHVLQRIEEYGKGVIMYSLGNFSFGGNHFPRDMDSAVVQLEVVRELDGTIHLGEMTIIPVSISSMNVQNNFQPTPYTPGSTEYDRTLSKLDGTFTGPDLNVDYSHLKPTEPPTEPPAGEDTGDGGETGGTDTPPAEGGDTPPAEGGNTPPPEGGDTGSAPEVPPQPPAGGDAPAGDE